MVSLVLLMALAAPDAGQSVPDGGTKPDAGIALAPASSDGLRALEKRLAELTAKTNDALTTLKERVASLEAKNTNLELQLQQANATAKRTADDYATFKKEVNEREDERRETERKALELRQRFDTVTRGFVAVDQQLAQGTAGNVNELIRQAETTYTGSALQYVRAAKAALANNDLGGARRYLLLAVLETQFTR